MSAVVLIKQVCESCGRFRRCELVKVDGQAFAVCALCAPGGDAA